MDVGCLDDEFDFNPGDMSEPDTGDVLRFCGDEGPPDDMGGFEVVLPAPGSPRRDTTTLPLIQSPQSLATTSSCCSPVVSACSPPFTDITFNTLSQDAAGRGTTPSTNEGAKRGLLLGRRVVTSHQRGQVGLAPP